MLSLDEIRELARDTSEYGRSLSRARRSSPTTESHSYRSPQMSDRSSQRPEPVRAPSRPTALPLGRSSKETQTSFLVSKSEDPLTTPIFRESGLETMSVGHISAYSSDRFNPPNREHPPNREQDELEGEIRRQMQRARAEIWRDAPNDSSLAAHDYLESRSLNPRSDSFSQSEIVAVDSNSAHQQRKRPESIPPLQFSLQHLDSQGFSRVSSARGRTLSTARSQERGLSTARSQEPRSVSKGSTSRETKKWDVSSVGKDNELTSDRLRALEKIVARLRTRGSGAASSQTPRDQQDSERRGNPNVANQSAAEMNLLNSTNTFLEEVSDGSCNVDLVNVVKLSSKTSSKAFRGRSRENPEDHVHFSVPRQQVESALRKTESAFGADDYQKHAALVNMSQSNSRSHGESTFKPALGLTQKKTDEYLGTSRSQFKSVGDRLTYMGQTYNRRFERTVEKWRNAKEEPFIQRANESKMLPKSNKMFTERGDIGTRSEKFVERREKGVEFRRQEMERREMEECSFKPTFISSYKGPSVVPHAPLTPRGVGSAGYRGVREPAIPMEDFVDPEGDDSSLGLLWDSQSASNSRVFKSSNPEFSTNFRNTNKAGEGFESGSTTPSSMYTTPFLQRVQAFQKRRSMNLEKKKAEVEDQSLDGCSFTPVMFTGRSKFSQKAEPKLYDRLERKVGTRPVKAGRFGNNSVVEAKP